MARYWENETPQTITTAKNTLQCYPKAGKLSVARPPWQDDNGVTKPGKTVALDVEALIEADGDAMQTARAVFSSVVERIDARLAAQ